MISFETAYAETSERLMLTSARARGIYDAAVESLVLDGEFWECGVYKGGSAKLIAGVLHDSPRPFRLFDTFRGFAGVSGSDGPAAREGFMSYSDRAVEEVSTFVFDDFVSIYQGRIPNTFAGLEDSKIAFLNLDVDLYQPTRDALAFVLPRMVKGGIIIVDDYLDPDWPGVEKAINEVLGSGVEFKHQNGTQARIKI